MKTGTFTAVLRVILGLFLILYALNRLFQFLPFSTDRMPDITQGFFAAASVYLPALYIFEILIGLLLIFNKWISFILIVLSPLSVAFLIFSMANGVAAQAWPAFVVATINVILIMDRLDVYKPLFDKYYGAT